MPASLFSLYTHGMTSFHAASPRNTLGLGIDAGGTQTRWALATVVASALLLTLPLDLATRTVVALLCGPLVGIVVHLAALGRAAR